MQGGVSMVSVKIGIVSFVVALELAFDALDVVADECSQSNALVCYTQALVRLQAAEDALKLARDDIKGLREELRTGLVFAAPVGSVIPMFLSSQQIASLAPVWLPADGRKV